MSARGGKATFTALEGPLAGTPFEVQYNPKEFKTDKSVTWGEHKDQGPETNGLEFTKIPPFTFSMDLYFDTTNEGNSDVRKKWVNGLMALTNAEVEVSESSEEGGDEGETQKIRPTTVLFSWGSFDCTCVVESVSTTYLMFSSDGTPIRAKVSVKLKEWDRSKYDAAQGGDYIEGSTVELVTSSGGTASEVAAAAGVSTRALLEANDIEDPTDIPAGTELVRPGSSSSDSSVSSNRSSSSASSTVSEIADAIAAASSAVTSLF